MPENKPTVLIVEDEVSRRDFFREIFEPLFGKDWLVFAETALEGIAKIRRGQYDIIFLDHDLGPDEITGTDVAACVHRSGNLGSRFFVHSMNPDGAARMVSILRELVRGEVCECAYCQPDFTKRAIEFVTKQ